MAERFETAEPDGSTKAALLRSLEQQRHHVLGALDGLSDEQLAAAVLPSGWSLLGLVNHLALDVEHYWFRCIVGGESLEFFGERSESPNGAWDTRGAPADAILRRYREEILRANELIDRTELDAPLATRDPWWGDWQPTDHRFVLLHVITETAAHAGHADAARELLDGHQWLVL